MEKVVLTEQRIKELRAVVNEIHDESIYTTDMEQFGVPEFWEYDPGTRKDCEDYDRKMMLRLRELGWNQRAMGRVCCRIYANDPDSYHAVLLINTDQGSYVVDNNSRRIIPFDKCTYTWDYDTFPPYLVE